MPQALLPDPRFRSNTAVAGKSDMRDENIYSCARAGNGGSGNVTIFPVPKGQTIPSFASVSAAAASHQATFTDTTTNLTKAGELGSGIGDASVRAIGITLEQARVSNAGVTTASNGGATQDDVADFLSKAAFEFKVSGKRQNMGPVWSFPSAGGVYGSISTTANATANALASNGVPGSIRRLKLPILIGRTDVVEGVLSVSAALSGTTSSTYLVWCMLHALIAGDVR